MCSEIENVIKHLSEDLALSSYLKIVSSKGAQLPRKLKGENSFYVSIFYKGKLIKERLVSSSPKENGASFPESISDFMNKFYQDFFDKNDKISPCSFKGKDETFLLQIGYTCIIVKNHNLEAASVFAYILGAYFTNDKASLGNTEIGSYHDIVELASKNNHQASSYFKQRNSVASASLGNHY